MLYTAETKLKVQNEKSYLTLTTIVVRTDMIFSDTFFCKYVKLSVIVCL